MVEFVLKTRQSERNEYNIVLKSLFPPTVGKIIRTWQEGCNCTDCKHHLDYEKFHPPTFHTFRKSNRVLRIFRVIKYEYNDFQKNYWLDVEVIK